MQPIHYLKGIYNKQPVKTQAKHNIHALTPAK